MKIEKDFKEFIALLNKNKVKYPGYIGGRFTDPYKDSHNRSMNGRRKKKLTVYKLKSSPSDPLSL